MGPSRHSGGDRGDWQEQPRPWEEDPYSPQLPHRPSEPPWNGNSHWSQAPTPEAPPLDAARYGQPPPSWGNDAPVGDAVWGQPPEWADESLGADDSHWAQPAATGEPYWDQRATAGAPPDGGDPYRGQPGDPLPGGGSQWEGSPPSSDGAHWAQPSSTGAPPPDGDPYWGQPPPWPGQAQPPPWPGQAQPGTWPGQAQPGTWVATGTVGPGDPAAGTTVLPGPGLPGTGPQTWPGPPRRRGRRAWVLIVAVAGVLALIAGILLGTRHNPGNASAGSIPTPGGTPGTTPGSTGTTAPATKRGPITAATIFPHAQLSVDGLRFTRVAAVTVVDCAYAANGAFASALTSAGCKRVVRATYVDSGKQYMVTAGVAALPTPADASKVDAVKKFGSDVWFTALNGPAGSGATAASKTVGVGNDVVDNRFIAFALSSYCDGHNPTGHSPDIQKLTGLSRSFTSQVERQLVGRAKSLSR